MRKRNSPRTGGEKSFRRFNYQCFVAGEEKMEQDSVIKAKQKAAAELASKKT